MMATADSRWAVTGATIVSDMVMGLLRSHSIGLQGVVSSVTSEYNRCARM